MSPAPFPKQLRTLVEALGLYPPGSVPARVLEKYVPDPDAALTWLIRQVNHGSSLPTIAVTPGGGAHEWRINGVDMVAPRRSPAFWAFYMAIRDGWSAPQWVFPGARPCNSAGNARTRVVAWLEQAGQRELAAEVRRCRLVGGRLVYDARRAAARIVCSE